MPEGLMDELGTTGGLATMPKALAQALKPRLVRPRGPRVPSYGQGSNAIGEHCYTRLGHAALPGAKPECVPFRTTGMCTRPPKPRAGEAAHRSARVIDDRCARPIGMSIYPAISIGEHSPRPRTTDQHHPLDHTRKYPRVWDAIVAGLSALYGNRAGDSVTGPGGNPRGVFASTHER